jgi:hypothetical protein
MTGDAACCRSCDQQGKMEGVVLPAVPGGDYPQQGEGLASCPHLDLQEHLSPAHITQSVKITLDNVN